MARLAYLLALPVLLAAVGCQKDNLAYCENHPAAFCPIDGPPEPQGCQGDPDCTQDPKATVCNLGNNTCVACGADGQSATCATTTPICEAHACRICRAHADCDSKACMPDGSCAMEGTVAYADDDNGSDGGECTLAAPCKTIAFALGKSRVNLKLHGSFTDGVVLGRSQTVLADAGVKLGKGSSGPIVQVNNNVTVSINDLQIDRTTSGTDPAIQANGSTTLVLNNVTVSNAKGNGISFTGAALTVNRCTIRDNGQAGISSGSGVVKINGSTIRSNTQVGVMITAGSLTMAASDVGNNIGGGISVNGTFDITNTFIYRNGKPDPQGSAIGGVSLTPGAGANRFDFNTVVDNHLKNSGTVPAGVFCDTADQMLANNIIAHNDVNGDANSTNANINAMNLCKFPTSAITAVLADLKFVGAGGEPGSYKLTSLSPAIHAATTASPVTVDFEGDPRPDGAKDQGADQYKAP